MQSENKRTQMIKDYFKIRKNEIKKNWILSLLELVLYIIPVLCIFPFFYNKISQHAILFVIIIVLIFFLKENNIRISIAEKEKLKKENSYLNQYTEQTSGFLEDLPDSYLYNISKSLNLKNSDRISLYVLSKDKIYIIGRYSENIVFNKRGRTTYPSNTGYISKCLNNSNGKLYYFIENLPQSEKLYTKKVVKDTNMSIDEVENLSMKSRSYFTRVVKDDRHNNVGILVIESLKQKLPINAEQLNNQLEELAISFLSDILEISKMMKGESSGG